MEAPEEVVDELYGAPLDEFTARRDARAKELRKSDRAQADAIKKLRKPTVAADAVNQLARRSPDDVEALLAAGSALRQAQLGGGDRDAIRSAARDEREAVERLVSDAASHGASPAIQEEVRGTLHAAALEDETRERVRRGVLTQARQAVGLGGFGTAPAPSPPRPRKKTPNRAPKSDDDAAAKQRAAEAEAERRRAANERVKQARAALKEAEKEATKADRERTQAQTALDRAEKAAAKAEQQVERRKQELEAAESDAG